MMGVTKSRMFSCLGHGVNGVSLKVIYSAGGARECSRYLYLIKFKAKMQVPLHLLCDDLLLYQEATGNMYKL